MTSHHCAELSSTYKDWAHYFVGVRPKLKQTRYRPLTAAQLRLRHTPMPPPRDWQASPDREDWTRLEIA